MRLLELLKSRAAGEKRTPFLPYTKYETAVRHAEQRRRRLRAQLAEVGAEGVLRREFLEIPPGMENVRTRTFADNLPEALGQMARLRWQLEADELLLAERLVDAIVLLRRQGARYPPPTTESYPLVKLEPLGAAGRDDLFPWKAVIETDEQEFYVQTLKPLQEWLGLGVDFAPRRSVKLFRQCIEPGGSEGVIGGLVEDSERFAMTCHHVLSPTCGSVKVRGNPYDSPEMILNQPDVDNEPDAALIDVNTPCLDVPAGSRMKRFTSATQQLVLQSAARRVKVFKLNARPKKNPGFVFSPVPIMPTSEYGAAFRFPHVEIKPYQQSYFSGWLRLPLFNNYFSQQGESGSWVVEKEMGIWFGMVIAGMEDGTTFAALGQPLLDFFEQQLKNLRRSSTSTKLAPFTVS
jgi:hypothetical protein